MFVVDSDFVAFHFHCAHFVPFQKDAQPQGDPRNPLARERKFAVKKNDDLLMSDDDDDDEDAHPLPPKPRRIKLENYRTFHVGTSAFMEAEFELNK